MSCLLEVKKAKRTGLTAAFLGGGLLAAAVPALNTTLRPEMFLSQQTPPVELLLDANGQMMALLNVLLAVAGACALYHLEYAGGAIRRMRCLPVRESRLFFGKAALLAGLCTLALLLEGAAVAACAVRWLGAGREIGGELLRSCGFSLLMLLPPLLLSLLFSALCGNMWISLGLGVSCVLTATVIPAEPFALTLFPFALPFRTLPGMEGELVRRYALAGAAEAAALALAAAAALKVRRELS